MSIFDFNLLRAHFDSAVLPFSTVDIAVLVLPILADVISCIAILMFFIFSAFLLKVIFGVAYISFPFLFDLVINFYIFITIF
jgi:hypothetical protein